MMIGGQELLNRFRKEQQAYTDQYRKQVQDREENACIIKVLQYM